MDVMSVKFHGFVGVRVSTIRKPPWELPDKVNDIFLPGI